MHQKESIGPMPLPSLYESLNVLCATIIVGLSTWLIKLNARFGIVESQIVSFQTRADRAENKQDDTATRLTRNEESVIHLRDGQVKLEKQLDSIENKVDALPRIEATLGQLSITVQNLNQRLDAKQT
jgi:hypothetical protein